MSAVMPQPVITSVFQEFVLPELLQHLGVDGASGFDGSITQLVGGGQGRVLQRTQQHANALLQSSTLLLLFAVVENGCLGHLEVVEITDKGTRFFDEKH